MTKVEKYLMYNLQSGIFNSKYRLWETGIWRICGEDPNCDYGGPHYQPYLETVEGKLEDVIAYAVELPHFFTWGGGGTIELIKIKKIDKQVQAKRRDINKQLESAEQLVKTLKSQLEQV